MYGALSTSCLWYFCSTSLASACTTHLSVAAKDPHFGLGDPVLVHPGAESKNKGQANGMSVNQTYRNEFRHGTG